MTHRRITRWSGLLLLVAAWLLLQQLAWVHGLSHAIAPQHAGGDAVVAVAADHAHHEGADSHDAHEGEHVLCCACIGLHGVGAALPSAAPSLPAGAGACGVPQQRIWASASLSPRWAMPPRGPPALSV